MPYQKYRPSKDRKVSTRPPRVSVSKTGLISINRTAYQEHMKGSNHVELFYDPTAKKIGIRPKKSKTRDGVKLSAVGKKKETYRVNGSNFLKSFDVSLGSSVKTTPTWDAKNKVVEVQI